MPSLLNGLSTMGAGISAYAGQAGLEQQKAALQQQSLTLADQLATEREKNVTQPFQASQQAAQIQSAQSIAAGQQSTARDVANIGAGATIQGETIRAGSAERVATIGAGADPAEVKLLRAIGALPPAGASPVSSPSPAAGGNATDATGSTAAPVPAASGAGSETPNPLATNIINKTLGLPLAGSEAASRQAIAQDVNNDPAFKYKTVGQKAAEVESRVAVATGKMTDPDSRSAMAALIASYQLPPLENYALTKPGGPETMAQVAKLNPDYQAARYPEINKAMAAFGSGKEGGILRAGNVGIQHLDVIDQAGAALGNGDVRALNSVKNAFQQQFGDAPPTTFDGLKQIVGTEIEKAVAGGIGSAADRDRLMEALNRANSPAQLQAITAGFRSLMAGQMIGLKQQYEDATGFKAGPFAFENKLLPATKRVLDSMSGVGGARAAATPAAATPANDAEPIAVPDQNGVTVQPPPARQSRPASASPDLLRLWGQ